MASSKKSRKSRRKRRRRSKQERFEKFTRRLQEGPLRGREIVVAPGGDVKMSEVLWAFVEPYREFADTEEALGKLLTLAVLAWNATLLPEGERPDMVDRVFDTLPPDEELRAGLKGIVDELIERKERYFSQYNRMIVGFELQDRGRDYHLTIASFLEDTSSR
jgi:predicted transcriptional regulator